MIARKNGAGSRGLQKILASKRPGNDLELLKAGIPALEGISAKIPSSRLSLPEQPFDRHLLAWSPLYRRSRILFLRGGGKFRPKLVSSPRTLSSPILLRQEIEYSPIESELVWALSDPVQKKDPRHFLALRTYSSSLFHEQSHRLLWKLLPAPASDSRSVRRFLNLAEALVVIADMALGDELGPMARLFYLAGVTYDPGTTIRREGLSRRQYRNFLQACLWATYLHLELYRPADIVRATRALFPGLGPLAERAARRALKLDRKFVLRTNPVWQWRFSKEVKKELGTRPGIRALRLPEDPMDNRLAYIYCEKFFDLLGL